MRILSIGEILWDVFPDTEKLGGAPLNFAVHAKRLGHDVTFISAVGADERGRAARRQLVELGLSDCFVQTVSSAPTGIVSVELDSSGQPTFTIHRRAAYDMLCLSEEARARLAEMNPDWAYYGTLLQWDAEARRETEVLLAQLPATRRFYDMNLRTNSYTDELVEALMASSNAVKLNEDEAAYVDRTFGNAHSTLREFTEYWRHKFGWSAVAVTRGADGCAIRIGEDYAESPGYEVAVADTVGAGDAFAAGFLHGLSLGWPASETGDFANRLGAVVASRRGGVPTWSIDECWSLKRQ